MAKRGVSGMEAVRPLRSQSLDTGVSDRIREMIVGGQLAPGLHLVEAELARLLGVSQGTVRAGLRALSHEGLVEYRQNRGVFVAPFFAQDAWEVYTLRNVLEAAAARFAAERIDDEGRARLRGIVARMKPGAKAVKESVLEKLDIELHTAIVELSGHSRLAAAYRVLAYQTDVFVTLAGKLPHEPGAIYEQHLQLVTAICDGDGARANDLASDHNTVDGERLVASLVAEA